MKKLLSTLFNHERYQSISVIIASLLLVVWWGCEPKAQSIRNPALKLNRLQLQSELDSIIVQVQNSVADMDKQEKVVNFLFEQALIIAESGTVNPVGILTSIAAILGIGAGVDNVRKRKELKTTKKPNGNTGPVNPDIPE